MKKRRHLINRETIKKYAALTFAVVLIAAGAVASALSMKPRVEAIDAVDEFDAKCFYFSEAPDTADLKFTGYGVIVHGTLTYDEGGATDPLFGVSADAVMLVRKSEMYQWVNDGGEYKKEWRADIVDAGEGEHENPGAFPLDAAPASYAAHTVRLGGYKVPDIMLTQLTSREKLTSLPEVDLGGFYTSGEYITNAADLSSPAVGDVRISYEYMTAREVTLTGMQREGGFAEWTSDINGDKLFRAFEGSVTRSDVLASFRRDADAPVWYLLIPGAAAVIGGSVLFVFSFMKSFGYKPTFSIKLKKKKTALSERGAALLYSLTFGILTAAVAASAAWIGTSPIWSLVFILLLGTFLFIIFIPDIVKNTPKRKKAEEEYVPILKKRDDLGKRG